MSFILSGTFHTLRNFRISFANINIHLLRQQYSQKPSFYQCKFRPLTTRAEVTPKPPKNTTPESIKLNINNTNIINPHLEAPIQCFPALQPDLKARVIIDRPATIVAFDIETTGFNVPSERIVEIAARNLMGGRNSTFQTLVNPQKHVRNSDVHGITTWMVNKPGVPRMEDVIPVFLEWLESIKEPGKPLILLAHNGKSFDFPFLIREMHRCGYDVPDDLLFFDTLPLARKLVDSDGSVLKKCRVENLCEFFGIVVDEAAHRAMGDVNRLSYIFQHTTFRLKYTVLDVINESLKASDIKWKPSK